MCVREIIWQFLDLSSTGVAKTVINSVTFAASYDFWRDFAGTGVLIVLGGVLPKWYLLF